VTDKDVPRDQPEVSGVSLAGRCRRVGCPNANGSGPCSLGHVNLLDCPDFEVATEELEASHAAAPASSSGAETAASVLELRGRRPIGTGAETISLPSGLALTLDEANAILRARDALVALPIGSVGVGKTTLLASVYERFCIGPFSDCRFAGSDSLLGFEDRCAEAAHASGRATPGTPRTSRDVARMFLNLRVQRLDKEMSSRELLIADISGEHLREFLEFNQPGPLGMLLKAASVVALLVDGASLGDAQKRYGAIAQARSALRLITERSDVAKTANVCVVLTKWDRCVDAKDINEVVGRLQRELDSVITGIQLIRSAARPDLTGALAEGFGTEEFLKALLVDRPTLPTVERVPAQSSRAVSAFQPGGRILGRFTSARAS
jgi:double-GTPase-like protein